MDIAKGISGAALMAGLALLPPTANAAEPVIGVTISAPLTPATLGVAAVVSLVANEAFAERPFGPDGEVMKILAAPVKILSGNVRAAENENGELAKILRATTGISARDMARFGFFGGPNSVFRKPLG